MPFCQIHFIVWAKVNVRPFNPCLCMMPGLLEVTKILIEIYKVLIVDKA